MSAVIASFNSTATVGTGRTLTVAAPAGATVGDTLIVIAAADNSTVFSSSTAGWTLRATTTKIGGNGQTAVWSTDAASGDFEVTSSDFQTLTAVYLRVTGADYANIVWGTTYQSRSTSIDIPAIIVPENDCLEILSASHDNGATTQATPAGFSITTTAPTTQDRQVIYEKLSASGDTGIRSVAISASRNNAGVSIAVPAASTGSGIAADTGTFALSGQDASFITASMLDADTGAFAISGQAVDFITPVAGTIDADTGSFTLSGQDAAFVTASVINADAGAFTVTGQDAEFVTPVIGVIDAATGAFSATGQDATFISASILFADTGAFDTTGQPITLTVGSALTADTGAFAIAGGSATFVTQSIIAADTGLFAISGQSVEIGTPSENRVFELEGQIRSNFTLFGQIRDTFETSGQIRPHFKFRT